jgi:hypothetical protein
MRDYVKHGRDAAIADILKWMEKEWPSVYLMNLEPATTSTLQNRKNRVIVQNAIKKTAPTLVWRTLSKEKWGTSPRLLIDAARIIFSEIEEALKQSKNVTIPGFGVFRVHFDSETGIPSIVFVMDPRWRNAINDPTSEADLGLFRRVTSDGRIEKAVKV